MIDFDAPPLKNVIKILMRNLKIANLADVKPRALKSADEKFLRTRKNAEVFTPSKIVKFMIDALDDGQIDSRWLEIACGEAPFITNRYDAESGEIISFNAREGILDRKLRRIPEGADKFIWAQRAVQSVYGYELQGDSLLIARANVFLAVAEFVKNFSIDEQKEIAEIISRNFWQTDALNPPPKQISLFDDAVDWQTGDEFILGGNNMKKFDFVIGNPPYNEETADTSDKPVYNILMEQAHKVGEKVELITPARFLFDAGKTPKDFNQRMLNDPHFKVLNYEPNARKVFKNVEIKGGVAITIRDETKDYGAIGTFIKTIHDKICVDKPFLHSLSEIIYTTGIFRFTEVFSKENSAAAKILIDSNAYFLTTNIFDKVPEIFFDDKPNDGREYIQIYGLEKNKRVFKWIRRDYLTPHKTLEKFTIFVPKSNNTGALGEVVSTPLVGCTQTFISVGAFDTRAEAEACLAYIKSKFCRTMLGILKVTQHNPPQTWAKVPLQDFTSESDIDWTVPIPEIDKQLYKKYGLDEEEIEFIEMHVKEMS